MPLVERVESRAHARFEQAISLLTREVLGLHGLVILTVSMSPFCHVKANNISQGAIHSDLAERSNGSSSRINGKRQHAAHRS
jgi:hypothetical protein